MSTSHTELSSITNFDDVKNETTSEYFRNNQFAIDAFQKKYTISDDENYVQAVKRVCDYIASCESTPELITYWSNRWFDEIYNDWWHPAGSIMQGAASGRKISLCNCTTISLGGKEDKEWDNLESIIKNAAYTVAKSAAYRQGLGIDFSKLRPRTSTVLNSAKESTGAVHWMKFIDSIGYYVGQKGRIPAMLFSLSCTHPDIEEFINIKSDYTKIQNANISVQCTDAFYKAVEENLDWTLSFTIPEVKKGEKVFVDQHSITMDSQYDAKTNQWYYIAKQNRHVETITKIINAKKLMMLIAKCMFQNAEPGIQNIDVAQKYSNSDYVYNPTHLHDSRILSTNACSEQYLSRESLCVLASANAGRFSIDSTIFNKEIEKIAFSINRFLDNVNEMELRTGTYATPHQRIAIEALRRTGAGFTNIDGWLFKQGLAYGTEEGNQAIEEFAKQYNFNLYKSSIALGNEKGSFGLFDRSKFEQSPFVKRMMKLGLEFTAMRNVTCSSIAPTGTLSLMFRDLVTSYGIEPSFGLYFWKRTRMSGKYDYYFCVPAVVRQYFEEHGIHLMDQDTIKDTWDGKHGKHIVELIEKNKDNIGIKYQNAANISPMEKLNLMSKVMKWCDSSISVTYLLPETSSPKNVYDFILEAHRKEIKSIACFPDKKMYGIISSIPFKELATNLINDKIEIHNQNFSHDELSQLHLETTQIVPTKIQKTIPLKRPKSLPCDVHHIKITKKLDKVRTFDYLVVVGLLNGEPYEVFVAENGKLDKKYTKGTLTKTKRGVYSVIFADGTVIDDITVDSTDTDDVFTRMTSTSLRHGADIMFVVEQLEKAEGDMWSFGKAMARALKKYIPDGAKIKGECPICGGQLVRQEGCKSCTQCEYSACS